MLANGAGRLQVARVAVERGPAARRHRRPAVLRRDEAVVLLGGGPGEPLPGRALVADALRDAERPGPEPAGGGGLVDRRERVAGVRVDRRVGGRERGRRHRGVVPHRALALAVQRQQLVEAVVGGTGLAVGLDQVHVEVDGRRVRGRVELGLPAVVVPLAAEGVDHRVEGGHVVAPAGQAAQADPRFLARLVQLGRVGARPAVQVGCCGMVMPAADSRDLL